MDKYMKVAAQLELPLHSEPEYLGSDPSSATTYSMALSNRLISPKPQFSHLKTGINNFINFTRQQ